MAYLMLLLLAAARYICADLSGRSQVRIPHFVLDILTPDREATVQAGSLFLFSPRSGLCILCVWTDMDGVPCLR
jgi:hypothetical protein